MTLGEKNQSIFYSLFRVEEFVDDEEKPTKVLNNHVPKTHSLFFRGRGGKEKKITLRLT